MTILLQALTILKLYYYFNTILSKVAAAALKCY